MNGIDRSGQVGALSDHLALNIAPYKWQQLDSSKRMDIAKGKGQSVRGT
jgi:hypothetical protein